MVLSIQISSQAEARLRERAAAAGMDIETFASQQLERISTHGGSLIALSGPVADAFAASGMSEDELSKMLEEEKHVMRKERRNHG